MATDSASTALARRAVAAYFAAIRAMNVQAFVAVFADNALTFDPDTAAPVEGHEELRAFFQARRSTFETLEQVEDAAFFAHEGAAVKWTGHGIRKGGGRVFFEGIDVFEVNEEGRIQTLWTYRDALPRPDSM